MSVTLCHIILVLHNFSTEVTISERIALNECEIT